MKKYYWIPFFIALVSSSCQTPSGNLPSVEKKEIRTENAPLPVGPYSQAIQVGNTVYLAGQIAINPSNGEMVQDSIEVETKQVMNNLKAVLAASNMTMENVVQTNIYLTDLGNYARVNATYAEYFDKAAPARVTVEVAALPKNANLEISMVAVGN